MVAILKTESYAEWFDGLRDLNAKAIIDTRLTRLALGNPGKTRSVGEGVQELKFAYGPGYRVYFLMDAARDEVTLLCGGHKGTQTRDIAKAKRIAKALKDEDDG